MDENKDFLNSETEGENNINSDADTTTNESTQESFSGAFSDEIAEMTGITLEVVTDSADNYDAAIVLCGVNDSTATRILSTLADGRAIAKSEGSKIYIGTNSISYGDSPAVNAFITEILGYDMNCGTALRSVVDVAAVDMTADI